MVFRAVQSHYTPLSAGRLYLKRDGGKIQKVRGKNGHPNKQDTEYRKSSN